MALETGGFVPKGNLDTDSSALGKSGQKETIKKVLASLKKYNLLILLSLVLATISVVFTLLVPIKIGDAIDHLGEGAMSAELNSLNENLLLAALFALIVGVSQWVMNLRVEFYSHLSHTDPQRLV